MNSGFSPKPVMTVDIVDFSLMSNHEQLRAIDALIEILHRAMAQDHDHPEWRVWSPAGDGGSITFEDIYDALNTALELNRRITARTEPPRFQVRVGLHVGTVTRATDFDGENIWGEGMNMSARVASLGKAGQVLASKDFCDRAELTSEKRLPVEVTFAGNRFVKHGKFVPVYNLYIEGAGLPPTTLDVWHDAFNDPLQMTLRTYDAMISEEIRGGSSFRVAVLCKRLLDLQPGYQRARDVLESISHKWQASSNLGTRDLYNPFFSPLSARAILYFFENARFQQYLAEQVVVEEGTEADSMMVVVSGEIGLYLRGEPVKPDADPDPAARPTEQGLVFREGAIIGEMGLFRDDKKRNATLRALKDTTTLILDYAHLKIQSDPTRTLSHTDYYKQRIQRQIWDINCRRIIQSLVDSHPLLLKLPSAERRALAAEAEFLPQTYQGAVRLTPKEAWDSWTLLVGGTLTASTPSGKALVYKGGDCLGPLRLTVTDNPFTEFKVAPRTQIVRFPWPLLKEILSRPSEFKAECERLGQADFARLKA